MDIKAGGLEGSIQDSLRELLDLTPYGIMVVGKDKTIRYANLAAVEVFGYDTEQDLLGKRCHQFVCTALESQCPVWDLGQRLDKSERQGIKKDGSRVPILKSAVPITLHGEHVLLEAFVDLSGIKSAQEFIRGILESVDEGFIVIDKDFKIQSANKAFLRQCGMKTEDILGKYCHQISHHSDRPCYEVGEKCAVRETFQSGKPCTALHEHKDSLGNSLYVETKSFPLRDSSGEVVSAIEIINDVTEKMKLEEQLRQSQKMEAIGTLTGGIAHDFNNILTSILGYGEFLQGDLQEGSRQRAYVDRIVTSGMKAAKLTQSLLAFSRKQIMHVDLVSLNTVVTNMESLLSRLIGEDIEIITDLCAEPLAAMADHAQLEQVLMNLATNARDALHKGGTIIISTSKLHIDEEFVEAHGFGAPGDYAVLSVTDNGKGIDEVLKQKIFEPFYTTKEVGKGTGLGLSVVYGIVKQHQGFINVYSEPGVGSTFKIYLPLSYEVPDEEQAAEPAGLSKGSQKLILLVEDDASVRQMFSATLVAAGYEVIEASDGDEAIIRFIENIGSIEIVLLDIIMPKKGGIQVYNEMKRIKPDLKVLLMSGYPSDLLHKKGLPHDDVPLLLKPVSPSELTRKVKEILER